MSMFWDFTFEVLLPWMLCADQLLLAWLILFEPDCWVLGGAYVSREGITTLRNELRDKQAELEALKEKSWPLN